jgi:hypothetical protein
MATLVPVNLATVATSTPRLAPPGRRRLGIGAAESALPWAPAVYRFAYRLYRFGYRFTVLRCKRRVLMLALANPLKQRRML